MRKLAAIMFTDIVGYTALMRSDERRAMNLLYYNRRLLEPIIQSHNGKILKEMGDGMLITFPSAVEAVRSAVEIQETLVDVPALNLRIGLHVGDVIEEGGDILGDGVNIASRIEPLAGPGGICMSQTVYEAVQSQKDISAKSVGNHTIKGIKQPQELYACLWGAAMAPSLAADIDIQTPSLWSATRRRIPIRLVELLGGVLFSIFLLFRLVDFLFTPKVEPGAISIAVFPFHNYQEVLEYDWLSYGFSESLAFKLSQVNDLQVIDQLRINRTLAESQTQVADLSSVIFARSQAKKMSVHHVLIGSYQIFGNEIKIITKLVDVESGVVMPLLEEVYPMDKPFEIQTDLGVKILALLPKYLGIETP